MAALNYYLGLQRGNDANVENVVAGTSSNGTGSDVELRIQINNGSAATNITRQDVVVAMRVLVAFINGGGSGPGGGANLPAL
jgi:hypothetical protein